MVDYVIHSETLWPMGYKDFHLHDTAADSYHRYKEDVALAAQLKMQMFRMSLSWVRVLPEGDASKPNKVAVDHYHNVIDEVLRYNMTPLITMYHFDHPRKLEEELGGWMDKRMVAKFGEFADFLLREYGSKVKLWTTINEPNVYCSYFTGMIELARGKTFDQILDVNLYPCLHNFLLGHGVAYKAFREGKYEGKMGFTVTTLLSRPATTSPQDVYASEAFNEMFAGMLLHPLVHGDYPQLVKDIAKDKLLVFTDEEKNMLKNSTDYIGLNVYYGMIAEYKDPATPRRLVDHPLRQLYQEANFINVGYRSDKGESLDNFPLSMVTADAMNSALLWTWNRYKLPIMITENGIGTPEMPGVDDAPRAAYHSAFMQSMVSTINDFGVKVIGYCAWSLIDSYEWSPGFGRPFGLVHIDYEGGSLNRTLKKSASFWQELAQTRAVPVVRQPSSAAGALAPTTALMAVLVAMSGLVGQML